MNPNDLRQRAADLETQAQALITSVAAENRDMTPAEKESSDGWLAEADKLDKRAAEIDQINARVAGRSQVQGRVSSPIVEAGESADDKKFRTGGFKSHGHFATALLRGCKPSGPDPDYAPMLADWRSLAGRVTRAVTGMNEASDAEGGLLIPMEYAQGIWQRSREEVNLSTRIQMVPIAGNTYTVNADAETSRANGSRRGGVVGYWDGEAGQYTASKPTFRRVELKLKKVTVLVYMTDEQIEDSGGGLESYVDDCASEEIAFKINDAMTNGTGAGIPLGLLKYPSRVTQTAVSAQGANTIVAQNIDDMWAHRWSRSEKKYLWLYNQDIESPLQRMYYSTGTNSGQLVYMPQGGIMGKPYATLKGAEMINLEQCQALGTEGDLILWDPTQTIGIYKTTGVNKAVSIHLRFDYGEVAFRYNMRIDVQSMWNTSITAFKGSASRSNVVTLSSTRT